MMIHKPSYFQLGASLYTPCSHKDLQMIMQKGILGARSMVFCLEDAVNEDELPYALTNIRKSLCRLERDRDFLRFIRPRNPMMLAELLRMPGIDKIDGFVLPKADLYSLPLFKAALNEHACTSFSLMPTLETEQIFDNKALIQIRTKLAEWCDNVCCLRIGGNDLMNVLGLKRMRGKTIYETPLRSVLDQLVVTFRPHGFELSAPVFDFIDDMETLVKEVEHDISYGLFAKTAIYPDQIGKIERQYITFIETHANQAGSVVHEQAAAVFSQQGQMMERTCHRHWAVRTLAFARGQGAA